MKAQKRTPGHPSTEKRSDRHDISTRYASELTDWARALSCGEIECLADALEPGFKLDDIAWFVDGNQEKRFSLLMKMLEFVHPSIEHLEDLVDEFVALHPFQALDSPSQDADRCLCWLEQSQPLTLEQRDYVACQRARFAVEELGSRYRLKYVRFRELLESTPRRLSGWNTRDSLQIEINPLHVWTIFHTPALLEEEQPTLPVDVIFFASGGGIRTAMVNPTARELFRQLSESSPRDLGDWSGISPQEVVEVSRELVSLELIAVC